MKPLQPVDLKQCQAEVVTTRNNTWQMGGRPEREVTRCEKAPVFIVSERTPGGDGRCGAMSLCLECTKVFTEKYVPAGRNPFDDYNMEPVQKD
jgi:hypothetical protein